MMVVDHSPSSLRLFTDQPFGFFSTAECFVFVSAFLAGMIFRKRAEKLGFEAARSSSISRAGRIYRAHLVTVGFAFVLGSLFLSELPGIRNLLGHFLTDPWATIGGSLALLFRPPLMDILPMYILFSLLTPAAFWAAYRLGWRTVLLISLSTWFVAQANVRDILLNTFKDSPFIQLGPFDLLAWQLIWVGGLFVGQRFQEKKALLPRSRLLRLLLLIFAIAFLVWRWSAIAFGPDPVTQTWLMDKWHLGPLRLINFFIAASVAATFLKYMTRWEAPLRPFLLIGRHMLPVFLQPNLPFCLAHRPDRLGQIDRRTGHLCSRNLPTVRRADLRLVFGMAFSGQGFGSSGADGAGHSPPQLNLGDAIERKFISFSPRQTTGLTTPLRRIQEARSCRLWKQMCVIRRRRILLPPAQVALLEFLTSRVPAFSVLNWASNEPPCRDYRLQAKRD